MSSFMSIISQILNGKIFSETNIENKLTLKHPSECPIASFDELDEKKEDSIPSPVIIPILTLYNKKSLTSFPSHLDYETIYYIIYETIFEYDPYFDKYEHYWLIIEKKKKQQSLIKISLFENFDNEIIIDFHSYDRNDKFWRIYKMIKEKCCNKKKETNKSQ